MKNQMSKAYRAEFEKMIVDLKVDRTPAWYSTIAEWKTGRNPGANDHLCHGGDVNDAGGRTAVAAVWRKYRTKQPGLAIIRNGRIGLHEENWLPLIRSLGTFAAVTNAVGD